MWDVELNIAGHQFVHRAAQRGSQAVDGRAIVSFAAHRIAGLPAHVRQQVRNLRAA